MAEANGGAEPLGEGADVRAKESVDCVGESVVRAEAAIGERRHGQARTHGVHHVRTWAWHGSARQPLPNLNCVESLELQREREREF